MSDQKIKNCHGHLESCNAIILYPALTSPALVPLHKEQDITAGELDIILLTQPSVKEHYLSGFIKKKLSPEFLRYCHSHLSLIKWRDLYGDPKSRHDSVKPDTANLPGVRFQKAEQSFAALHNIAAHQNMIYNIDQHDWPSIGDKCQGWYLEEMKDEDQMVFLMGDKTKPLGILGKDATKIYLAGGYSSLFHLRFKDIPNRDAGMYELNWLAYKYSANDYAKPFHFIPELQTILPAFTKEIVEGGEKANGQALLFPATDPVSEAPLPQNEIDRCQNSYALFSTGADYATKEQKEQFSQNSSSDKLNALPCMTQTGHLFAPRHPVYFCKKDLLDIGIIADPHISSRQSLYKLVGARVIPGVDAAKLVQVKRQDGQTGINDVFALQQSGKIVPPDPGDSPLIGTMAHENLQSTRELFFKTAQKSDAVLIAGDMYDHIRNCDPAKYRKLAKEDDVACRTGTLWKYLDYDKYKANFSLYPRYIDAMLGLELIYQAYTEGKPVIYIVGNHEAYEDAYGTSPRLIDYEELKKYIQDMLPTINLSQDEISSLFIFIEDAIVKNFSMEEIQRRILEHPVLNGQYVGEIKNFFRARIEEIKTFFRQNPITNKVLAGGIMKLNPGIPLDHNLTFYEAILLYGPSYPDVTTIRRDGLGPFRKENFAWLRQFLSPWKDICISYGTRQNILCLDWGKSEQYLLNAIPFIGGDTLPVAGSALTNLQYKLFKERVSEKSNSEAVNILASHFTYAAYTHSVPLLSDRYNPKLGGLPVLAKEPPPIEQNYALIGDGRCYDIGTFTGYRKEVWKELVARHVPYLISGHTHRPGLFDIELLPLIPDTPNIIRSMSGMDVPGMEDMKNIDLTQKRNKESPAVLVSGSCGTYNKQNIWGELGKMGMDKPQAMVLKLTKGHEAVQIIRSAAPPPRIAVVLNYLWDEENKHLFAHTNNYHITSSGLDEPYSFTINPTLRKYFFARHKDRLYSENPIEKIKLHAVIVTEDGKAIHIGCLVMKSELFDPPAYTGQVKLDIKGKDLTAFMEKYLPGIADNKKPVFFCSVHFNAQAFISLPNEYDCSIPWAFPAAVDAVNVDTRSNKLNVFQIRRGWQSQAVIGNEIPAFSQYINIFEYKNSKKRQRF